MPPSVSIIVPCYNEARTIAKLLSSIHAQTYPLASLEVVIADGLSGDQTRAEITAFAELHPALHIVVVDNPRRHIPVALNLALAQAQGEIIIRLDAHSMPFPDYVENCVANLEAGLGENVGGVWQIEPGAPGWMAAAIAAAASHPLGVGDALYRHASKATEVDTVPFGAFKRELLALVGFFDESLLANEDYEFNTRIRKFGGKIWLDPAIRSVYFARPTLSALARQYFNYGFWKWRMLRRYPKSLRWRQALPPLFVSGLVFLALLGIFWPLAWFLLAGVSALYLLILALAGIQVAFRRGMAALALGLPVAIALMHLTWGSGFLWSMIKGWMPQKQAEQA